MADGNLTLNVRHVSDTSSVVDIVGDISSASEKAMMDAYAQAVAQGARNIILNFTGLDYMNSTGVGLLVTLLIRTRRQQHRLVACGLTSHYVKIFELTRLKDAITVYPSEAEALKALNGSQ